MSRRAVLITGAGQRLGAATASRLMDEGWFVFIHVNSSLEAAQKLLEESRQLKIVTGRYNYVVDLLTEEQQRKLHQWYVDTGVINEEKE